MDEPIPMICVAVCLSYARGGVSMRAVAIRYEVSFEYVRKIRKQQLRTGQMRRIAQSRYGVRRRVDELLAGAFVSRSSVSRIGLWTSCATGFGGMRACL